MTPADLNAIKRRMDVALAEPDDRERALVDFVRNDCAALIAEVERLTKALAKISVEIQPEKVNLRIVRGIVRQALERRAAEPPASTETGAKRGKQGEQQKPCVTPNGRTDGHFIYGERGTDGKLVCPFCGRGPKPKEGA